MAVLVLAVVLAALVAGISALSSALGLRVRSIGPIAGVAVVGAVLLVALTGVVARGGGDTDGEEDPEPATEVDDDPAVAEPAPRRPAAELGFRGDGIPAPPAVLDRLLDGDAPLLVVRGLLPNAAGSASQCIGDRRSCAPAVPFRTDEAGAAAVVVPVSDRVGGAPCADRCVLRFDVDNVGPTVELVFGAPAPRRPSVHVEPESVRPGDVVQVVVTGLEPGAEASVTQCTLAVDPSDPCGGPAPVVPVVAGRDGIATVAYEVVTGDLGAPGGASCRRGDWCGITVVDGATVLAEPAELRLLGSAGVEHDGARLAVGLAVATVLAAVATWLMRTTEWGAVGLPSTTDDAPDPV